MPLGTGSPRWTRAPDPFQIKLLHKVVFSVLSGCVAYALYSGVAGDVTVWTGIALGLVLAESVALIACG